MAVDIGLTYDPVRQRCDISIARGDVVLDTTPVTPMLLSLLAERSAHPNDTLPSATGLPESTPPVVSNRRRGWPGDALDAQGRRIGSRLWLLRGAKQTEPTRLLAQSIAAEALAWLTQERALKVQLTVEWVRRGMLGIRAVAGAASVSVGQLL